MKTASFLSIVLMLGIVTAPVYCAAQDQQSAPPPEAAPVQAQPMGPDQLDQLVAPIALYPDSLVAQILAASTYPTQIVEADRWLEANPGLQGQALADAANSQPWDPSVKALVQFPSVLSNMNQNLSWTQSLGDAYYNQPQDVMNAIQDMRQKAEQAGNLRTTPQQTVTTNGPDVVIEPANPDYVYVPIYDPWTIYGAPFGIWPGFVFGPVWVGHPYFGFGVGINIGFWRGYGWGWPAWGFNWHARQLYYNRAPWVPRGPAFFNHGAPPAYRAGAGAPYRGAAPAYRGGAPEYHAAPHPVEPPVGRGFGAPHGQSGVNSGAFSGYAHGGVTHGYSARGMSSMGGAHGGGGHAGGGGRR